MAAPLRWADAAWNRTSGITSRNWQRRSRQTSRFRFSDGCYWLSTPPPTPDLGTLAVSDGKGIPKGQKIKLMGMALDLWRERGLDARISSEELLARWAEAGEQ